MLDRELLDKIGSLVKCENHHQFIDEEDLRFLYSDIGLFCQLLEILDRNGIEIRKKSESGRLLKERVLEYQKGKDHKLIEEIASLSMYYIYSQVFSLGKKYNIPFEELIYYAYKGFLFSINSYDESRKHPITEYIPKNIYYYILHYIAEKPKYKKNILYLDKENKSSLEKIDKEKYYVIDARINEIVSANEIKNYLDILTPIQKRIIELYYGFNDNDKYSMIEIGTMTKLSRQAVSLYHGEAIKKIKKRIKKEGKEEYYIDK